ncbi:MAG: ABC transporter substrate-binding protein [Betaproteobacteria bacterium]|nr:ABC transporter substrate-binding protein [Betaproteobacteria bacterium]MDH5351810.1 ABC transporter substrate-binding protein [Betaproteobacteria bacterium]
MMKRLASLLTVAASAMLVMPAHVHAQKYGGELIFPVPSEPPSYDGHREETFGLIHPLAPFYNTLLRVDPNDRGGTKPYPSIAESWTASADGKTYTFKIRSGVKFHDGSTLTSKDVKASYDKIIFPPEGVGSSRKGQYADVASVEAPDASTVVFRLKRPSGSFIASLLSPYNFIYKADILAKDMHWYEKNIMGTGPFTFVEHVKGSHVVGKKNANYWDKGKPYLDGFRAIFIRSSSAQVAAVRGERAHIQFRGFTPADRDSLKAALGDKITVQESPWDCILMVALNHEKKPFDDKRVRRALSLALDRYQASEALSKIAIVKSVAGVQVPGTPYATPPEELEKIAGYWKDIDKSRAEARRLLKEAGAENLSFTFKNRGTPMPYEPLAVWLIDQWRQIGVTVKQEVIEPAAYYTPLRSGDFQVAMDFQCGYIVEPDLDMYKFLSVDRNHANYGRYTDRVLDEMYDKQSSATSDEERKKYIRAFEKRLLDEEAHYLMTLQWHRIIPHSSKVKGWTVTPSHYLNNTLDVVWLDQ